MLAPCSKRKLDTAATIPGWSGQEISRRAVPVVRRLGAESASGFTLLYTAMSLTTLKNLGLLRGLRVQQEVLYTGSGLAERTPFAMSWPSQTDRACYSRFEVLPLGRSEEEAAQLPEAARLAVTCSPKHGPDQSVAVAERLRALGYPVTVHLAARMVRDRAHLDELLEGMGQTGVDDVFLIAGDATPPHGPYSSAVELLPVIDGHPRRPAKIGIAGYPEGHPLIDPSSLAEALERKSRLADYITTQLCFDPEAVLAWLADLRE